MVWSTAQHASTAVRHTPKVCRNISKMSMRKCVQICFRRPSGKSERVLIGSGLRAPRESRPGLGAQRKWRCCRTAAPGPGYGILGADVEIREGGGGTEAAMGAVLFAERRQEARYQTHRRRLKRKVRPSPWGSLMEQQPVSPFPPGAKNHDTADVFQRMSYSSARLREGDDPHSSISAKHEAAVTACPSLPSRAHILAPATHHGGCTFLPTGASGTFDGPAGPPGAVASSTHPRRSNRAKQARRVVPCLACNRHTRV